MFRRAFQIQHNSKNRKINVWNSVIMKISKEQCKWYFLLSVHTSEFMNLYYFLHCQITKSKDFFLTNGDEGLAFYELIVLIILDQFFNVHFFFTMQLQLY